MSDSSAIHSTQLHPTPSEGDLGDQGVTMGLIFALGVSGAILALERMSMLDLYFILPAVGWL